jgi:hypothetical protein
MDGIQEGFPVFMGKLAGGFLSLRTGAFRRIEQAQVLDLERCLLRNGVC